MTKTILSAALSVLAITTTAAIPAMAQDLRADDSFEVTVLHPVTVGDKVLQPGEYTIKPMNIAGGDPPVLLIHNTGDLKTQIAVKIIPTLENRVQPETRVSYRRVGGHYYFDTIWQKGALFGFKFELPKDVPRAAR